MTKFRFHIGDIVKEKGKKIGVQGEVIGLGRGAGTDWYRIESRGEVYNAQDDELELDPAEVEIKSGASNIVELTYLAWYRPEKKPYEGELCLLCLEHDPDDTWTARFDGEVWQAEIAEGCTVPIDPSMVRCWAAYRPPVVPEREEKSEEDESWADGVGQAFSPDAED